MSLKKLVLNKIKYRKNLYEYISRNDSVIYGWYGTVVRLTTGYAIDVYQCLNSEFDFRPWRDILDTTVRGKCVSEF